MGRLANGMVLLGLLLGIEGCATASQGAPQRVDLQHYHLPVMLNGPQGDTDAASSVNGRAVELSVEDSKWGFMATVVTNVHAGATQQHSDRGDDVSAEPVARRLNEMTEDQDRVFYVDHIQFEAKRQTTFFLVVVAGGHASSEGTSVRVSGEMEAK